MFDEVFWDAKNDMMGLLRSPIGDESKQSGYEARRGILGFPESIPCYTNRKYRSLLPLLELHRGQWTTNVG